MNMQPAPKISIITCVFNGERYISKLLNSVLNMGYPNIEHIIVNDGSTDGTEDIVLKYIDLYRNKENCNLYIKYIKQKNMGLGGATNSGLKEITGDYWTWINCDDWYEPQAFNLAIKYFNDDKDVLILNYYQNSADGNEKKKPRIKAIESRKYNNQYKLRKLMYTQKMAFLHFIVKTSSFDNINPDRVIDPFRYTNDTQYAATIFGNLTTHFMYKPVINFLVRDNSFYSEGREIDKRGFFETRLKSIMLLSIDEKNKNSQICLFKINDCCKQFSQHYSMNDKKAFLDSYRNNYLLLKTSILPEHKKYINNKSCFFYLFSYYFPLWWKVRHFFKKTKDNFFNK